MQYINNPDTPVFSNPNKPVIPAVPKLRPDTPSSTDKTPGRKAMRTELSINDIRSSAWNATQGSPTSYQFLQEQNRKLAKIANSRLKALKAADLDMFAYDRAITYLNNRGLKQFSLKLASADDFQGMVNQLSELITFINSKTSTVKGAREALDAKLEKISEYTGTTYTEEQKFRLGHLLGTDSISTLLRDIRGNSDEVIEILEEISSNEITNDMKQDLTNIVDHYLEGWQPFDMAPWSIKSRGMTYDELMDELRRLQDE